MKNYVQKGENITIPAPAVILSGEAVVVGHLHGVAAGNADEGAPLDLVTEGVFDLPKVDAQAIEIGARVYLTSSKLVTTTASGNSLFAIAVEAAAAGAATVRVKLVP